MKWIIAETKRRNRISKRLYKIDLTQRVIRVKIYDAKGGGWTLTFKKWPIFNHYGQDMGEKQR